MFPILYHAHHSHHTEDLPFWLELANRHGDPILELGCGTGRVLLPLARHGHRVFGLDNHRGMLASLLHNLTGQEQPPPCVLQGDMTNFHLAVCFRLILLPCNTFSTLSTAGRRSTLERIQEHLAPDGRFVASLPNPRLLAQLPTWSEAEVEEVFPHPLDGEPVQVSSTWKRTRQHFTLTWHYDHLLPDGRVERLSAHVQHHLAPVETYLAELQDAGFSAVELFGDFDRSPYSPDSPYLLLVAGRKPAPPMIT